MKSLQALETPCFILDKQEFCTSIKNFYDALAPHFKEAIIGYSVKTNSLPYCLQLARCSGCYAEVVSRDEFELAVECGFPLVKIVYNGPMKSKETFLDCIKAGGVVNIETFREIEWLAELDTRKIYKVGIRVNVNLSKVSPADENHEDDDSRFGFSAESGDLAKALDKLAAYKHVALVGVHMHRTSKTRSLDCYRNVINYVMTTIKGLNLNLEYIDVGGGFYGNMPNKPSFTDYAQTISQTLSKYIETKDTLIIVEPGNALLASAFSYMISVFDVKQHDGTHYITTDGSRNDIDPFFRKTSYNCEVITNIQNEIVPKQAVSGCTCLEYDRLFELNDKPLLSVGDKIFFKWVGAYTMTLTPMFIRYIPNVYMKDNDEYSFVRYRWTAKEQMMNSLLTQ